MPLKQFDVKKAFLRGPDFFKRLTVKGDGKPLAGARLTGDTELLIVERGDQALAFVMRELARPHTAQGTLAGVPYLVSF